MPSEYHKRIYEQARDRGLPHEEAWRLAEKPFIYSIGKDVESPGGYSRGFLNNFRDMKNSLPDPGHRAWSPEPWRNSYKPSGYHHDPVCEPYRPSPRDRHNFDYQGYRREDFRHGDSPHKLPKPAEDRYNDHREHDRLWYSPQRRPNAGEKYRPTEPCGDTNLYDPWNSAGSAGGHSYPQAKPAKEKPIPKFSRPTDTHIGRLEDMNKNQFKAYLDRRQREKEMDTDPRSHGGRPPPRLRSPEPDRRRRPRRDSIDDCNVVCHRPSIDLYTVLGVSRSASQDDIKKAYRKLCVKYHPDRAAPGEVRRATDKMAEINRAHAVLGDERKRKFYDRKGTIPPAGW